MEEITDSMCKCNLVCAHQWFKIRGIKKHTCASEDFCKESNGGDAWICENYQYGILVQCPTCDKTKELWG